jgi:hypothetical protein
MSIRKLVSYFAQCSRCDQALHPQQDTRQRATEWAAHEGWTPSAVPGPVPGPANPLPLESITVEGSYEIDQRQRSRLRPTLQ